MKEEDGKEMHIFESEKNIMSLLWERGDMTATDIAKALAGTVGWNRNTTYTVIKKSVEKGLIERMEPHFICHALVSKEEAQDAALHSLLNRWFGGSAELLMCSLLGRKSVSEKELEEMKQLLEKMEV